MVAPFELDGRPVSSGPIRDALAAGRLDDAAVLLGFPWFVSGEVIHGDKRGRELGFPTANVSLDAACGLRHGVYAVRVAHGGRRYDGVANFVREPFGHLLDQPQVGSFNFQMMYSVGRCAVLK